jgi:hypothetical protein
VSTATRATRSGTLRCSAVQHYRHLHIAPAVSRPRNRLADNGTGPAWHWAALARHWAALAWHWAALASHWAALAWHWASGQWDRAGRPYEPRQPHAVVGEGVGVMRAAAAGAGVVMRRATRHVPSNCRAVQHMCCVLRCRMRVACCATHVARCQVRPRVLGVRRVGRGASRRLPQTRSRLRCGRHRRAADSFGVSLPIAPTGRPACPSCRL